MPLLRPHMVAAAKAANAGRLGRVGGALRDLGFALATGPVVELASVPRSNGANGASLVGRRCCPPYPADRPRPENEAATWWSLRP
jgi:hypothetical protein